MNKIILILALLISINIYAKPIRFKKKEFKKERTYFWSQLKYVEIKIKKNRFTRADLLPLSVFITRINKTVKNNKEDILLVSNEWFYKIIVNIKNTKIKYNLLNTAQLNKNKELIPKYKNQYKNSIANIAKNINAILKENPKIENAYCNDEIMAPFFMKNPAELANEYLEKIAEFAKIGDIPNIKNCFEEAIKILKKDENYLENSVEISVKYAKYLVSIKEYKDAKKLLNNDLEIKTDGYYKIYVHLELANIANIEKKYRVVESQYKLSEKLIKQYLGIDSDEMLSLYEKYIEFYKKMNNKEKVFFYKNILKDFYPEKFPEFFEQPEDESFLGDSDL